MRFNQRLSPIKQDAGWLATLFVAENFAVLWIFCLFRDACQLKCFLVGPGGKSMKPDQKHGIIRRDIAQGPIRRIM